MNEITEWILGGGVRPIKLSSLPYNNSPPPPPPPPPITVTTAIKERARMTRSIHTGSTITSGSGTAACAACKFLRRKCTTQCLFAPYFPPDQPQKFANVHKVFGVSNITKMLHDLPGYQREDAVNSLAYEADARVKDPVYGCVGAISILQQEVRHLQDELVTARAELNMLRMVLIADSAAAARGSSPTTNDQSTNDHAQGLASSTFSSAADVHEHVCLLHRTNFGHTTAV